MHAVVLHGALSLDALDSTRGPYPEDHVNASSLAVDSSLSFVTVSVCGAVVCETSASLSCPSVTSSIAPSVASVKAWVVGAVVGVLRPLWYVRCSSLDNRKF